MAKIAQIDRSGYRDSAPVVCSRSPDASPLPISGLGRICGGSVAMPRPYPSAPEDGRTRGSRCKGTVAAPRP